MNKFPLILFANLVVSITACQAQPTHENADVSQCDNCEFFPLEWLQIDDEKAIEFDTLPPDQHLDFLVGDWNLYFPNGKPGDDDYQSPDEPIAHERFEWFGKKVSIHGDQYWGDKDAPGFQARSELRYVAENDRWQWTWMTIGSYALMSGGIAPDGSIVFRQFVLEGDQNNLTISPDKDHIQYVFRNVTADQFIQEEWRQAESGIGPYNRLMWRVLYRRARAD